MHKGYDYFIPNSDTVSEMECKVCGTVCDVERGVVGPRSYAAAMAKAYVKHDSFTCPHSEEDWHEKALALLQDIEECNSPSIKKIMEDDLKEMVKEGLENEK